MNGPFRIAYALSLHTETSDDSSCVTGVNPEVAGELFVAVLGCGSDERLDGGDHLSSSSKTLLTQQTVQLSSMPFGHVQTRCHFSDSPQPQASPKRKAVLSSPSVDAAVAKVSNFVIHVEYVASGVSERTVVFQAMLSTTDDKPIAGSFRFQLPKVACTESLLLAAGSHTVIEVCVGCGIQSPSSAPSSDLSGAPPVLDDVFASAVQGHHDAFREHVVHPRYRALKQCFNTAVDDVLVLEMKLDSVMYEMDAMTEAARLPPPPVKETNAEVHIDEIIVPSAGSQSGDAPRLSSSEGGGNLEARRLRSMLQAKESELAILRARVAAIEETRRAESQSMRDQLSRFKVKRREIVDKSKVPHRGRSKTPPAGTKDSKNVAATSAGVSNTETTTTTVINVATLPSTSNAVQKQPAAVAPASRSSSRQVSPAFRHLSPVIRQQSPMRNAAAKALAQRTLSTSLSRGAIAVLKCETDHKERLQRIEESFSRLQTRQVGAPAAASVQRNPSTGIGFHAVPSFPAAVSAAPVPERRSISPLRVPDVQTVRRVAKLSPSPSQNSALKVSSPARNQESFQTQLSSKSNVTTTTTQRGVSPTAAASVLRISPLRFNAVLATGDQKPPMQRR